MTYIKYIIDYLLQPNVARNSGVSIERIHFTMPNCFEPTQFYNFMIEQKDFILKESLKDGYAPMEVIEKEFNLALEFVKYSEDLKSGNKISTEMINLKDREKIGCFSYCLFHLLLDMYCSCYVNYTTAYYYTLTSLISIPRAINKNFNLNETKQLDHVKCDESSFKSSNYATLILTENADIHSVVDEVVKSWKNLRSPWNIRKILVQENIKDKFLSLLEKNLPKIDPIYEADAGLVQDFQSGLKSLAEKGIKLVQASNNDTLKATVAIGVPMTHVGVMQMQSVPIIVLDSFRTSKEAINLADTEGKGEFVSIWSENVTETFEYVKCLNSSTIWVNCHGVFNPKCPVSIYGIKYCMQNGKKMFE